MIQWNVIPVRYKLVAFDLDGTLVDEVEYVWQLINDIAGRDEKRWASFRDRFSI